MKDRIREDAWGKALNEVNLPNNPLDLTPGIVQKERTRIRVFMNVGDYEMMDSAIHALYTATLKAVAGGHPKSQELAALVIDWRE